MKYTFLIIAFALGYTVSAQESLSLAEAIQAGLSNNYDIQIERGNISAAELNNVWGETNLFPSLNATLNGSKVVFENKEAINPFSILGKTTTAQIQPGINLNWNLLSIYNIQISKRRLEQLQAESNGNASIVIANSIQSIILGYYAAVLEKERLEQFQKQLDLSRDKYSKLEIRKDLGSAITSDLLLEEGNYLTDSTSLINQELQYKNAISNLNYLLGIQEPAPFYELTDSLDLDLMEVNLEELIIQMEQDNVDLKKQYLTQSILGVDSKLRQWDRMPTLNVGANYTLTRNEQDVSDWPLNRREIRDQNGNVIDVLTIGNNENLNYGVNFTLSFNLFNGGKINRAIQRAQIQENIGEIRIDRMKASLRRDLKQAVDQYNVRRQLYQINLRRSESAQQNLDISKDKYENGSIDSFDFRTIQNNYLIASIQKLQSIYNLIDSKITIMRLTGGLVQEYN